MPPDNPFVAEGGKLARYFAYGIRNSFGLGFDPVTGKLWATENGPADYDEINLVEPGFNSGWEQIMGPDARDPQGEDDLFPIPGSHYSDPEFSWLDTVAPTAIVFLNSIRLGVEYLHDAFVGDVVNATLYRFQPNATRNGFEFQNPGLQDGVADDDQELDELVFGTGFGSGVGITDLKVGPDGLLYVVSIFEGRVFRVRSTTVSAPVIFASPPLVDFGPVSLGEDRISSITIDNGGNADLFITDVTLDSAPDLSQCDAFELMHPTPPFMVVQGGMSIDVIFTPDQIRPFDCIATFESTDPVNPLVEIRLKGDGVTPPDVDVRLTSRTNQVSQGGVFPFDFEIVNTTGDIEEFAFVMFLRPPPVDQGFLLGQPVPIGLPPFGSVLQSLSVPLAPDAPLGIWRVTGVAIRPGEDIVDLSELEFIVTSAP